jgi:transcriptional regulator with XRE-family HTH domain
MRRRSAKRSASPKRHGHPEEPSIGARVGEPRKQHHYSIRTLARRAGVSASLISGVERSKMEPSISTLKRIPNALGTTLTYFFSDPRASNSRGKGL